MRGALNFIGIFVFKGGANNMTAHVNRYYVNVIFKYTLITIFNVVINY